MEYKAQEKGIAKTAGTAKRNAAPAVCCLYIFNHS